ncbi:hypothetical protein FGF1_37220 [Flavobacteriaceae bacterium GF1]
MKISLMFILMVMLSTCGGGESSEVAVDTTYETSTAKITDFQDSETQQISNRKMIWTGNVEIKVKSVDETTEKVNEICKKYNAFVSKMNLNNTSYEISNNITIRVESQHFTSLMEDLKGQGDFVKNVSISSNDVTEQYIDVTSRLKTKKEVRERYIEILKNRTGKISEVLEAEEAIRKITEEIEAKEGQLRYLEDRIKFSTINLRIYEKVNFREEPDSYEKSFGSKVVQALENGWSIVTTMVLVLFNIWPLILVGGVLVWRWKWLRRKFSRRK